MEYCRHHSGLRPKMTTKRLLRVHLHFASVNLHEVRESIVGILYSLNERDMLYVVLAGTVLKLDDQGHKGYVPGRMCVSSCRISLTL